MMLLHRKAPVEKKSCTRREEGRSTVTTDPGHEKRVGNSEQEGNDNQKQEW